MQIISQPVDERSCFKGGEPVAKAGPAESSDWLKEPKDEEDPIQISEKVI